MSHDHSQHGANLLDQEGGGNSRHAGNHVGHAQQNADELAVEVPPLRKPECGKCLHGERARERVQREPGTKARHHLDALLLSEAQNALGHHGAARLGRRAERGVADSHGGPGERVGHEHAAVGDERREVLLPLELRHGEASGKRAARLRPISERAVPSEEDGDVCGPAGGLQAPGGQHAVGQTGLLDGEEGAALAAAGADHAHDASQDEDGVIGAEGKGEAGKDL